MKLRCPNCSTEINSLTGTANRISCPNCGTILVTDLAQTITIAASDTASQASPALQFGRYRITGVLGSGGFGIVYQAYDEELDRQVAIKVPHSGVENEKSVDQFLSEARILAGLCHCGIVAVYDFGRTEDGSCYVVSQFINGSTLKDRMRREPITCAKSALIVSKIAEALHHAHQRGLAHRDVKPANILLSDDDEPTVVDFGLALQERSSSEKSSSAGTPSYMSPEQARGEGHLVDGRTDIYSLGVVFYELLTGRLPFERESQSELLRDIQFREPKPPRQIHHTIPKELERICLHCLQKRASERYTTAQDLADDLRNWVESAKQPIHSENHSDSVDRPSETKISAVKPLGSRREVTGRFQFGSLGCGFTLTIVACLVIAPILIIGSLGSNASKSFNQVSSRIGSSSEPPPDTSNKPREAEQRPALSKSEQFMPDMPPMPMPDVPAPMPEVLPPEQPFSISGELARREEKSSTGAPGSTLDPASPIEELVQPLMMRADEALKNGDFERAINLLNQAAKLDPTSRRIYAILANVYVEQARQHMKEHQFASAINCLNRALEADSANVNAHLELSKLYASCPVAYFRDAQRAIQHARAACERTNYTELRCVLALARAYEEAGDSEQAARWQEKANALRSEEQPLRAPSDDNRPQREPVETSPET